MIKFSQSGDWSKINSFFEKSKNLVKLGFLDEYGRKGVEALKAFTPVDTGKTADSWYYRIVREKDRTSLEWLNSNSNEGIPIAILIQYGHAYENGSYIEGVDFINPALKPIFQEILDEITTKVRKEL